MSYLLWVLCVVTGWSLVQRNPTGCDVSECDRAAWIKKRPCPIWACYTMVGEHYKNQPVNVWGNNCHLFFKSYRTHCVDKTPRFHIQAGGIHSIQCTLTLRLLMSYIFGAPSNARYANVVYIWTYVWQRWNSLFLFAAQCFNTESMQRGFLCHICV